MEVKFEEALSEIGDFGRYQIILSVLLLITIAFPGAFVAFSEVFVSAIPDHWCKGPSSLAHLPLEIRKNLTLPTEIRDGVEKFERCRMYDVDYDAITNQSAGLSIWIRNSSWKTKKCNNGWEFDETYYHSTTATTFNLVCENDWWPTLSISLFYAGSVIGSVACGWITDKYGRRNSFFINLFFVILLPLISAFSPSYEFYVTIRFLIGFTFPGVFQVPFILALEMVGKEYRTAIGMLASASWGISTTVLGGIASLIRSWSKLIIVTTIPLTTIATYWWFLPESPRWSIAQDRLEEAEKTMQKIAKINRRKASENLIQKYSTTGTDKKEEVGMTSPFVLYKTPNMRKKMLLINLIWVINAIVYHMLSYMSAKLGVSDYLAFALLGLVETPSCLLSWWAMQRWGRRLTTFVAMLVVGIVCMANGFVPEDYSVLNVILPTVGKFFITGTFSIVYIFAGELLPTVARGTGLSFMSVVAAITMVPSPYINYLVVYSRTLPLIILGLMSLVGGVAAIFLPETLGISLPQTMEDGEEFGKDLKVFSTLIHKKEKQTIQNGIQAKT
ncbi:hypothetical protein CHUAL_011464 [Chamberlinius hualienensis]